MRWENNHERSEGNNIKKESDLGRYQGTNPEFAGDEWYKTYHKNQQPNNHDEVQTGFLSNTMPRF
jgi:hypothetical protein